MEITLKSIVLFSTLIITGLSAGFFYAWQVSIIPGTLKVSDQVYLQTMQSINKEILNPAFFLIFFGSFILLSIGSIYEFHANPTAFWFMLLATISYLLGTLGITIFGNVPLNDQLEALNLSTLSEANFLDFRTHFEGKWNRLHLIRTVCSILSFVLLALAFYFDKK